MTDPLDDMLRGVAQVLHDNAIGDWQPVAASSAPWPIVLYTAPQSAGKAIVLNHYRLGALPGLTDTLIGLQVLVRGDRDPGTASAKANDVFAVLQGRRVLPTPGGTLVNQIYWQSETQLGPDQNGRADRSSNYYVQMNIAHNGAT